MGCFEETEQFIFIWRLCRGHGGGDELADVLRLAHEDDLEFAVVQVHLPGVELQHAPHGGGIARHAEDEFAGIRLPLRLDGYGVGADERQILDALEDIGEVAHGVLHRLRGGVGGARKGSERSRVGKAAAV